LLLNEFELISFAAIEVSQQDPNASSTTCRTLYDISAYFVT